MTERPIIYSTEMVRAILEDHKTKTRRLSGLEDVNTYPGLLEGDSHVGPLGYRGRLASARYLTKRLKTEYNKTPGVFHWFMGMRADRVREFNPIPVKCPYGQTGDLLWVRETWGAVSPHEEPASLEECKIEYRADYPGGWSEEDARGYEWAPKWRPSIHMPRWAARIWLEVVDVRAERVNSISYADCITEGMLPDAPLNNYGTGAIPRDAFAALWDELNAKRGYPWKSNPFVWVITFRRIER